MFHANCNIKNRLNSSFEKDNSILKNVLNRSWCAIFSNTILMFPKKIFWQWHIFKVQVYFTDISYFSSSDILYWSWIIFLLCFKLSWLARCINWTSSPEKKWFRNKKLMVQILVFRQEITLKITSFTFKMCWGQTSARNFTKF